MTRRATTAPPKLGPNDQVIGRSLALGLLPRREVGAHKWGVGGLVIVAGAPGYAGAAVLSSMAAGRAGAGIVTLACSRSVAATVVGVVPETATLPLPESESGAGSKRTREQLEQRIEKSHALLIGPGLGQDEASTALLRSLFGSVRSRVSIGFGRGTSAADDAASVLSADGGVVVRSGKPVVIDADGLNWLAAQDDWWAWMPAGRATLTPHAGEMARLTGTEGEAVTADPLGVAREAAARWRQTVVLKCGHTVVSDGERTMVAPDAPPSLATAGSGDVLAGTIAALVAQGLSGFDAATLAIYVGSRAARRVERRTGTLGLVAGDLPLAIAEELASLERGEEEGSGV